MTRKLSRRIALLVMAPALALSGAAAAQEPPAPPAADFVITPRPAPARAEPAESDQSRLLLGTARSDRMTMPVQIGAGGPYDFLIDTGSQRTIVATEIAQRLALPALPPVQIVSMAGRVTVSAVMLGGLRFGDHAIETLNALSIAHSDLGSAGLIGLDSLKDKRLTLDFRNRRMDVGKSRRRPVRADADTIIVEARSKFGQLILVDSKVDGRKVNVILDTGAEMSIGNMALFNKLKVKKLLVPPQPTTLTSVTGLEVPAQFTVVRKLTIGSVTLNNVPMVFLDAAPFEELDLADKPAMLLGMRMRRLFDQVAIDFGNRHVDFRIRDSAASYGGSQFASALAADAGRR